MCSLISLWLVSIYGDIWRHQSLEALEFVKSVVRWIEIRVVCCLKWLLFEMVKSCEKVKFRWAHFQYDVLKLVAIVRRCHSLCPCGRVGWLSQQKFLFFSSGYFTFFLTCILSQFRSALRHAGGTQ